ncbi:MAG: ORF6N domain-containing protein [Acidobacteria bacterium]|nr:ORF6N domain-containing protein [Acidobacteriota bacterium]
MPKALSQPINIVPAESIEGCILSIRGQKVMLDRDLAEVYRVPTKRVNEQVRRNPGRFPSDFGFRLTKDEWEEIRLRSHYATLKTGRGEYSKYMPMVFTEHGAPMLASVLDSKKAIEFSVQVVRAFMRMRAVLAEHQELARRVVPEKKKGKIGFPCQ